MGAAGRRRWVVLGTGAVCAVVVVAVGVRHVVDDGPASDASADIDAGDVLSEEQLELIHRAVPDPSCSSEPSPPQDDGSLVPLDVVRVEGTCLDARTEHVPADRVDERRAELARDPSVVAAAVVPVASPTQVDDRRDDQWALDALGADEGSTDLPWPDGDGVVVAVVDTGVDARHGDLADAVVARRHYPGETELDPMETETEDGTERGHGTQVAGIIAARRDHGGIVGVAPGASILDAPAHLAGAEENPDSPWVGLAWAVNHGADVANLSFGSHLSDYPLGSDALEVALGAVEFALHNDIVVVTGAGNCGNRGPWGKCTEANARQVPAVFGGVVAVGAAEEDLHLAGYSTRNDTVDLVAPGGGDDPKVLTTSPGGGLAGFNGTSAAAPHVAAAAAVLRNAAPEATAREVRTALVDSANPGGVHEDDRSDPGAGRGFLDIVSALDRLRTQSLPSDELADRTQVGFVQDGTLFAFDGDVAHPVRRLDPGAPVTWLEWSADHTRLIGLTGSTLFSWSGPGTEAVEVPYQFACEACGPGLAYLDDIGEPVDERTGDLVVSLDYDASLSQDALTLYDARTLEELGRRALSFPADAPGTKTLLGAAGGRLVVHESGGAQASERLWLVDPATGEAEQSHEVGGYVQGRIAVDAAGDRIALVAGYDPCSSDNHVYVLDGGNLSEIAGPATPPDTVVDELFFNGDTVYATMTYVVPDSETLPCDEALAGSAGIWRLDGDEWEQVHANPLANARPLEGRPGDEPTGWLLVELDGRASLRPSEADDVSLGELGAVDDELWSTPTRNEVDLGFGGSGGGGGEGQPETSTPPPGDGGGALVPATVEAAVARFEEFVHALGAGDVATACAIGRVAVEVGGAGLSCEQAIPLLREMSTDEELAALSDASVDPSQVEQTAPNRVEIPPAPPYSTAPETDPPVVLEHDGTNWYVVQ
jgi:subtilisin family serine protease